MIDTTRNTGGPDLMLPCPPIKPDGVTALVDDFIRDGWVRPEDRIPHIMEIYRCQRDAHWRAILAAGAHRERAAYAEGWTERVLDYLEMPEDRE